MMKYMYLHVSIHFTVIINRRVLHMLQLLSGLFKFRFNFTLFNRELMTIRRERKRKNNNVTSLSLSFCSLTISPSHFAAGPVLVSFQLPNEYTHLLQMPI